MDIRRWTPDEILCLPDFCFGRQFPIFSSCVLDNGTWVADISEAAFPDPCVLWEVNVSVWRAAGATVWVRMALADRLPVDEAEFMTLEPFLHGFGNQGAEPRKVVTYLYPGAMGFGCKTFLRTSGRKLCLCASGAAGSYSYVYVTAVVSVVPREVPDWLSWAKVRSQ